MRGEKATGLARADVFRRGMGIAIAKRRPRAQVRKLRGRGRPGRLDGRIRRDYLTDEEGADGERVLPRAARERSDQARSREDEPRTSEALKVGDILAFRGLFADVVARPDVTGPPAGAEGDAPGIGPLEDAGAPRGPVFPCTLRGRLETADSEDRALMAVGDRVEFSVPERSGGERAGVIERMLPRRNVLLRAAPGTRHSATGRSRHPRFRHVIAANVDGVLLMTSAREPRFRPGIVDRFLVAAASQELPASLVINKSDLVRDEKTRARIDEFRSLYESLGVKVVVTSAVERTGIDELASILASGRIVLVGHSGVGKSSLLNVLDPGLELPARPVNRKTGKGTHTTSVARLLRLSSGVEVVDTPGIRELDITELAPSDLEAHFPEFLPLIEKCEKDNCSHRDEPGCAVTAGVESGEVHPRRYESYLAIFASLMRSERPYAR